VIGSHTSVGDPQHPLDPQQEAAVDPPATLRAIRPYFSRTESFSSCAMSISIEVS
jgi:hypothetical protein